MRELAPSWPTLACLALCAAILVIAAVDRAHTESRLPEVQARGCESTDASCFNDALSERLARESAAEPLQDQYDTRAWLYASAILAIAAVAVANSLRVQPRKRWLRIFSDLGIIGVWVGIAAVVLLLASSDASIAVPPAQILTIPVSLLVAGAAGTLIGRSEGWGEESAADGVRERAVQLGKLVIHVGTGGAAKRSRLERAARSLAHAALGLTGLTALLAIVFVLPQPDCGGGSAPPGWTSPIDSIAAVTGIGAVAAGVGGLVLRRWLAALISLVVNPVALLAIVVSTCAFY